MPLTTRADELTMTGVYFLKHKTYSIFMYKLQRRRLGGAHTSAKRAIILILILSELNVRFVLHSQTSTSFRSHSRTNRTQLIESLLAQAATSHISLRRAR